VLAPQVKPTTCYLTCSPEARGCIGAHSRDVHKRAKPFSVLPCKVPPDSVYKYKKRKRKLLWQGMINAIPPVAYLCSPLRPSFL
jgi:hypothetical protein